MENKYFFNIKLLCEKYNYKVGVFSNKIEILNNINKVIIEIENNDTFAIRYNLNSIEKILLVSKEMIYDSVLNLLKREDTEEILIPTGIPIEIEEWYNLEKKGALEIINEIKSELNYNYRIKNIDFKSNRFNVCFYNGILILEDRNKSYLPNIFKFNEIIKSEIK